MFVPYTEESGYSYIDSKILIDNQNKKYNIKFSAICRFKKVANKIVEIRPRGELPYAEDIETVTKPFGEYVIDFLNISQDSEIYNIARRYYKDARSNYIKLCKQYSGDVELIYSAMNLWVEATCLEYAKELLKIKGITPFNLMDFATFCHIFPDGEDSYKLRDTDPTDDDIENWVKEYEEYIETEQHQLKTLVELGVNNNSYFEKDFLNFLIDIGKIKIGVQEIKPKDSSLTSANSEFALLKNIFDNNDFGYLYQSGGKNPNADFLWFDLMRLLLDCRPLIKKCELCKKYFVPKNINARYCDNTSLRDYRYTCKEYITHKGYYTKTMSNEGMKLRKNIRQRLEKRVKSSSDSDALAEHKQKLNDFKAQDREWKEKLKKETATAQDYFNWLNKYNNEDLN